MLKKIITFLGFGAPPPPPPKRRKTARKAPASKPAEPVPVAPPAPVVRIQDVVPLPNFALALRTYIRQWGNHGPKPSRERLDAAAHALGADFSAFLTALNMTDGQLTRFLVPESSMKNLAVDIGLREKICLACYSELDTWKDAEKKDLAARTNARQHGRPIPPELHVPEEVRAALLKRLSDDAARLLRGGGQGGRGGGVNPVPPEAMGIPEPVMLDPEGGGRTRVSGAAKPPDEAVSANEAAGDAPSFRMPSSGGKRRRGDDTEETATGKHQPPLSPDDGEPEGGGLRLPRF